MRKAFVKYLKFHRYRLGLTQDQLAHEIGISQGHYCEIERGFKKPRPELHKRIADAIGRPVKELTEKLHGVSAAEMGMASAK